MGLDLVVSLALASTGACGLPASTGDAFGGSCGRRQCDCRGLQRRCSGLFRNLPRGSDTEWFLGSVVGLGLGGVLGIGLAVVLLEASEPLSSLAHWGLYWAGASTIFLAVTVAYLPIFAYERARARHMNHDE